MNLVFISYSFGDDSPVGVGALRIVNAMVENGCCVYVITSTPYNSSNPRLIVKTVSNTPRLPSKYSFLLSNFFQKELNYYSWEIKAKRAIRIILRHEQIHGIYTRSTPICVCPVGIYAKTHFHIPLIMHFTDPIPAPEGWAPNPSYRKRMIKQMQEYVRSADLISFGNDRMLKYQEKLLSCLFGSRAFISPDPASGRFEYLAQAERNTRKITLLFLGNIYGNRNPKNLFEAINSITSKSFRFIIYGIRFFNAPSFVEFRPRTNNIETALNEADILVDLDGDDENPVFISSKLKDYLSVNRPIISITPLESPSRDLLQNLKTVEVSQNTPEEIKRCLIKMTDSNYLQADYEERIPILQSFASDLIANDIMCRIRTQLSMNI